jgi:probable F420-dependent oxidoreductase
MVTVAGVVDVAPARWGLTVPLSGLSLPDHAELVRTLPSWGFTDLWSAEVAGTDAFTPLALASTWTDRLRLGTAIASVYTRGPALLAMSAAAMAEAAPGRFVLGLGAASPTVVESWNGMAFERAYEHTRDVLRVVRAALAGERVDYAGPTLRVTGFRLERPPIQAPPILLAALRPQMLRLAGSAADGAILNWLSAADVERCVAEIGRADAEVVARIFVCPTEDADHARTVGRRLIAAYLTVPAYAAFHAWLGRDLSGLNEAWAAGDRRAAVASIDDEVVDALIVHGSPARCRARVAEYVRHGVTTPVLALLPGPEAGPDAGPATVASVLAELGPDGRTSDAPA